MNIYICSTVRHLLFSLLKATSEQAEPSHIVFFYDYQDIDPSSFDTSVLPQHITISLLSRHNLNKQLSKTWKGRIYRFLAMRNVTLPVYFKEDFTKLLSQQDQALTNALNHNDFNLFVFNEHNKMSRLFRLLKSHYQMIEDGTANYYRIKLSRSKWLGRVLQGMTPTHKVYGESKNCLSVYLLSPEKAPSEISHKTIEINFLEDIERAQAVRNFFCFDAQELKNRQESLLILATQPLFNHDVGQEYFYEIFREIIEQTEKLGSTVVLKCHPTENPVVYQQYFPNVAIAPTKLPLELLLLDCQVKPKVISIASSAGMGLEKYCDIVRLISDDELSNHKRIMHQWQKTPSSLSQLVAKKLS